jgi:cell wall-associated NlpC family hydrolase
MTPLDPRVTPARPDLAAAYLKGKVAAERFVEGEVRDVVDPQAPLRREPSHDARLDTEALKGERVTVYETDQEGWCWVQLEADRYVGWMPANALRPPGPPPTHKVAVPRTLVFSGPDIKLPPVESLPFGARLAVTRMQNAFAVCSYGHVPARHVAPLKAKERDFVAVAERFLGAPYLWGGKTVAGIDCSGLVQVALNAAGIKCPRDSDMQRKSLGKRIGTGRSLAGLKRGDLIFWDGHVAIVRDRKSIVHANGFHMAVAIEPLKDAVRRMGAAGTELIAVKRL